MSFGWKVDSVDELQRILAESGSEARIVEMPVTEVTASQGRTNPPAAPDTPKGAVEAQGAPVTEVTAQARTPSSGKPQPRKKLKRTEHEEQVALFERASREIENYPELSLMFAIPNGAKLPYTRKEDGTRYSRQGVIMKQEGLRAGVPDIFLPAPVVFRTAGGKRHQWHGLFVEMKVGRRKPTNEQEEWLYHLRQMGYAVVVAYGAQQAWEAITAYLEGRLQAQEE